MKMVFLKIISVSKKLNVHDLICVNAQLLSN